MRKNNDTEAGGRREERGMERRDWGERDVKKRQR